MSTVVLDTITGKSTATTITIGSTPVVSASANSMTIRGEGSNQTSIQQGLIKAWWTYDQASTLLEDSYNIASLTDNGTGNHTGTYTVAMAATTYAVSGVCEANGLIQVHSDGAKVAASLRMQTGDGLGSGGVLDYDECSVMVSGDLS
jgi:hypothetical protein